MQCRQEAGLGDARPWWFKKHHKSYCAKEDVCKKDTLRAELKRTLTPQLVRSAIREGDGLPSTHTTGKRPVEPSLAESDNDALAKRHVQSISMESAAPSFA